MYISPPLSLYVGKALNQLLTYFCYNYCEYFCPFIYHKKCKFQSADIKRRPSLFLTFEPIFQGHTGWEGNGNSLQFNLISADRLLTIRLASVGVHFLILSCSKEAFSFFCLLRNPSQWIIYWSHIYKSPPRSGPCTSLFARQTCFFYYFYFVLFFSDWLVFEQAVGVTNWNKTR